MYTIRRSLILERDGLKDLLHKAEEAADKVRETLGAEVDRLLAAKAQLQSELKQTQNDLSESTIR
jgi:hypothetical protein